MNLYRIKQIDNKYIAQLLPLSMDMLYGWQGIDRYYGNDSMDNNTWFTEHYQLLYCPVDSLEKAKAIIEKYKKLNQNKKIKKKVIVKYHMA